jgi:hypothetical protein
MIVVPPLNKLESKIQKSNAIPEGIVLYAAQSVQLVK